MKIVYLSMKHSRFLGISLCVLVASILAIGLYYHSIYTTHESISFFEDELKSFIVPPVTLNGTTYKIQEGKVLTEEDISYKDRFTILSTGYYSVKSRVNPIFGIEGTDPEKLEDSIEALNKAVTKIAALYTKEESRFITENIHPFSFLRKLPTLEKKRLEVKERPSPEAVIDYHSSLEKVFSEYQSYINTIQKNKYVDLNKKDFFDYNYWGGFTNVEILSLATEDIEKEIFQRKEIFNSRLDCFKGKVDACQKIQKSDMRVAEQQNQEKVLNQEETGRFDIHKNMIMEANGMLRDLYTTHSPLVVVLEESRCFTHSPQTYHLSWTQTFDVGTHSLHTEELSDIFFYDTEKGVDGSFLYNAKMHGLPFLYQNPSNLYMCLESAHDISKINTLRDIKKLLIEKPIFTQEESFSDVPKEKEVRELHSLEMSIIESSELREAEVVEYISIVSGLLNDFGEVALSQYLGEEKVLLLQKLMVMSQENSSSLDRIINTVIREHSTLPRQIALSQNISLEQLFLGRGYIPLFLLTFNSDVVQDASFMEERETQLESFNLVSYTNTLREKFREKEIIDLIAGGERFYYSL